MTIINKLLIAVVLLSSLNTPITVHGQDDGNLDIQLDINENEPTVEDRELSFTERHPEYRVLFTEEFNDELETKLTEEQTEVDAFQNTLFTVPTERVDLAENIRLQLFKTDNIPVASRQTSMGAMSQFVSEVANWSTGQIVMLVIGLIVVTISVIQLFRRRKQS